MPLQVYEDSDSIADFSDYWQLAAHEVPGDEADAAAAAAPQQPLQPQPVAEQQQLVRMRHLPPPSDSSEKPGLLVRSEKEFMLTGFWRQSSLQTAINAACCMPHCTPIGC